MKARFIVLAVIVLCWGMVAVLFAVLAPLRQARVTSTSTPTRTPKPTFTLTSTPTITWTPSPTPTPTYTPTTTPTPTNTPTPTATDTPAPTPTQTVTPLPSSTPTATQQPTRRPPPPPTATSPPQPTNTPAPPFTGRIIRGYTNCSGLKSVTGFVSRSNGDPYAGAAIGVWSDAWAGNVSLSEVNGKFDVSLTALPAGTYRVAVVKLDTCSQQDGRPTANDCQFLSNIIDNVTITDNCEGEGANQVTEVEFTGP